MYVSFTKRNQNANKYTLDINSEYRSEFGVCITKTLLWLILTTIFKANGKTSGVLKRMRIVDRRLYLRK